VRDAVLQMSVTRTDLDCPDSTARTGRREKQLPHPLRAKDPSHAVGVLRASGAPGLRRAIRKAAGLKPGATRGAERTKGEKRACCEHKDGAHGDGGSYNVG